MPDEKDLKIIKVLKDDSRKPIRDIAKLTKLRPSTVHSRLQKLKKDGIIEKFKKLNSYWEELSPGVYSTEFKGSQIIRVIG